MDFYTVKQAKARSVDFIRRFPVTEDQELRLQDTTVSRKLVVLALEKPLYPRPGCCGM